MKLCVFQGTFNPIHNAHLRVADYVCKNFKFDKLLFIPACEPPHKATNPNMAKHRLEMVKLALQKDSRFELSDIEYKRGGKSYTYLTVKELYDLYPIEGKINFIIGTDAFSKIESWYEIDKLKEIIKFIVFIREENFSSSDYNYLKDRGYDFEFQALPYKDISSTEFRQNIKDGKNIDNFVPVEVKEYIEKYELYKD